MITKNVHKPQKGQTFDGDKVVNVSGQVFKNTLADRAVKEKKWRSQQSARPKIQCENVDLEHVYKFTYLGSIFAADGQECFDINARIARATKRCGQLSQIFDSPNIGPRLKIRLYAVAVGSLMTYGCESWTLTDKVQRRINGANSQMLSHITGNSVQVEARRSTTSLDIIKHIKTMRMRWLCNLLRDDNVQQRLIYHAILLHNYHGGLLSDVPEHRNLEHLAELVKNESFWNNHIRYL